MNPHRVLSEFLFPSRHGSLPGGQSQGEGEAGGAAPQVQEKDQQVRQLGSLYTRTGTVLCTSIFKREIFKGVGGEEQNIVRESWSTSAV